MHAQFAEPEPETSVSTPLVACSASITDQNWRITSPARAYFRGYRSAGDFFRRPDDLADGKPRPVPKLNELLGLPARSQSRAATCASAKSRNVDVITNAASIGRGVICSKDLD